MKVLRFVCKTDVFDEDVQEGSRIGGKCVDLDVGRRFVLEQDRDARWRGLDLVHVCAADRQRSRKKERKKRKGKEERTNSCKDRPNDISSWRCVNRRR